MPGSDDDVESINGQVLGDTQAQTRALEENARAVRYHAWLCSLALPFLGDHPIELGSGLGNYVAAWLDSGVPRITATEADPDRLARLHERFRGEPRVDVVDLDLDRPPAGSWSAFVSFNVLEHIPDDVAALASARRMIRPGGHVVTFAPAFPFAMSRFDREIGHMRRYTLASMRAAHDKAGLAITQVRYVNAPGLLAWTAGMKVMRMTPQDGPILRLWDSLVVPAARRLESTVEPPFGQSVLAVAVRREDA